MKNTTLLFLVLVLIFLSSCQQSCSKSGRLATAKAAAEKTKTQDMIENDHSSAVISEDTPNVFTFTPTRIEVVPAVEGEFLLDNVISAHSYKAQLFFIGALNGKEYSITLHESVYNDYKDYGLEAGVQGQKRAKALDEEEIQKAKKCYQSITESENSELQINIVDGKLIEVIRNNKFDEKKVGNAFVRQSEAEVLWPYKK